MELIFRLFAFTVFAAESIISPLPDHSAALQPNVSFGVLTERVPAVLAETTVAPTPTPSPSPTPTPEIHYANRKAVTIALLGDSMTDTLGPEAPALKDLLSTYYPHSTFRILNYGIGATNIDDGLARLTRDYTYQGRHMDPLVSVDPDIVVVESFGYNPYPTDNGYLERHWMALAHIVDELHSALPNTRIVIAATIAPNSTVFGDGAAGLSFDPQSKRDKVARIGEYLRNTIAFAKSQNLPLADSYHDSVQADGNGALIYINGGDHIHYSDAGRVLFDTKVFDAIVTNKLLE